MAEFCKHCARQLNMKPDPLPLLCEGCGKWIESYDKHKVIKFLKLFRR